MRNLLGRLRRPISRSQLTKSLTLISDGDGSTLSLDFTAMSSLDSRFTFTRASTGTYINSIGLVTTMAAASTNDPTKARFDYDPTTLAPRGLLIEGTATNVCLRSEDFGNALWQVDNSGATNPVVSTVSQTAPNGASTVNRVTLNKTGGTFSRLYQAITGTAGQTYTLSVWMKANTANGGAATQNVSLRIGGSNGVNCVVTTTWQRFTHPAFAITGTDANFQLLLWDNVPANDETADVLVWGAQVELGSGASSYIPTGASTVQRLADECSMTGANFSSWYTAAQGTLFTDVEYTALSGNQSGIQLADNSGASETNRLSIRRNIAIATRANVTARQFTPTGTGRAKSAFAYGTADYRFAQNGSTFSAVAGDNGAPPNSIDRMTMFGPGPTQIYGWLRGIKFWPTALSQATINNLTTL